MNCHKCRDLLSDYLDGVVEPDVSVRMEKHLQECAPCQALQADLQRMLTACETVFHPVGHPSVRLRPAKISEPLVASPSWRKRFTEHYVEIRLSLAQCIAVAALASAVIGLVGAQICRPSDAHPAVISAKRSVETHLLRESSESLGKALDRRRTKWSAEARRAFERDMAPINKVVLECEQKAQEQPGEAADAALVTSYQEKLKILHKFAAE